MERQTDPYGKAMKKYTDGQHECKKQSIIAMIAFKTSALL